MNSGRVLRLTLTNSEVEALTEVMCAHGCSMEDAARLLINKQHARDLQMRDYMRDYMRGYRKKHARKGKRDG
jgi:hypothetical protein